LRSGKLDFLFGVLRRPDWIHDINEEPLFLNQYVVVACKGHPLETQKTLSLRDLLRYDWIMPGSSTPRQQALERLFVGMAEQPRISIETTSMQIYRAILGSTDRLTLMSLAESQLNDNSALTVLPFRSPHLRRVDGVATRADWQPTRIHQQFLDLLRQQAKQAASVTSSRSGRAVVQPAVRRASGQKPARRKLRRDAVSPVRMRVR
jgi:LysR family transcriptional regulator of gallate degradation